MNYLKITSLAFYSSFLRTDINYISVYKHTHKYVQPYTYLYIHVYTCDF